VTGRELENLAVTLLSEVGSGWPYISDSSRYSFPMHLGDAFFLCTLSYVSLFLSGSCESYLKIKVERKSIQILFGISLCS
jgi:hypothetical protein